MKKTFTHILYTLIAICNLFLLSSCKANLITHIEPDGSGTYVQEVGFTAEEISSLSSMGNGASICDSTSSDMSSMPSNTVMREEKRGDEIWCIFEAPFSSLEELKSIYGSTNIVINEISLVDKTINYDVTLDMTGGDFGSMLGMLDLKWIVEMPGKVSDHNADETNGSTLTWNLTPRENINIHAVSKNGGFSTNILIGVGLLCLCILILVLIAGVVFFVVRRNNAK